MIEGLRDIMSLPLEPARKPVRDFGYIRISGSPDVDDSRINGYVDRLESARQILWHIYHTERGTVPFMDRDDGIELQQFIGESFGYLQTKIAQVLEDAILREDIFTYVTVLSVTQPQPRVAKAEVEVGTIFGILYEMFDVPLGAVA